MQMDSPLFPEIESFRQDFLEVSRLHRLYIEEAGNPIGEPVVFLHGGPGGGTSPLARRFFDPAFYHVILFDQRGCGKSTPNAELDENTTWDLIDDIERIRSMLGIDRWLVVGGSWGSTLALAYAICHPNRVTGLILRGIFLGRRSEYDWLYQNGASQVFPDGWADFLAPIPAGERGNMLNAYYQRLILNDPSVRLAYARHWCRWETHCSRLEPDWEAINKEEEAEKVLAMARIEAHYFMNGCFFPEDDWLLRQAPALKQIPTRIIQGRYDMVCPIRSAWELKTAVPSFDLQIVGLAGHSVRDVNIASRLVQATEDFKKLFAQTVYNAQKKQ